MKRIFKTLATAMAVLAVASCTDEALTQRVENLEARMDAVEAQLKTDAGNIKTLLDAVNNGVTIQSVTPITEGFRVVFSNGKSFDITNGAKGDKGDTGATGATGAKGDKGDTGATGATGAKGDKGDTGAAGAAGKDGTSPVVTIEQGTDGNWYWVINGVNTGVKANGDKGDKGDKGDAGADGADGNDGAAGAAGAVPSFKIENGHVYYSFDGTTWEDAGELSSSSTCPIVDVNVDEENGVVTFTLAGGAEFVLSLDKQTFALIVPELNFVVSNGSVSIPYVLRGASSEAVVLAYFVGNVPAASIEVTDEAVEITATSSLESATLVIEAIDNALDSNNCAKKVIRFEDGVFIMEDSQKEFNVPAEGGTVTFAFKSNLEIIVSTADYEWIKPVSTKAVKEYTETYEVLANDSESPREGQLDILDFSQNPLATVTIHQEGKPAPKFTVEDAISYYEGSFKFGMFNGSVMQGPQTEDGAMKIAASDDASKGNVMFTLFNGNDCKIYASFDLVSGEITVASGATITTKSYSNRVLDRDVVFTLDEATKSILSCAPQSVVCSVAPGVPIYYAIDEMSYEKAEEPISVTVADFIGTYSGGVSETMGMNGTIYGTQDRTSTPADFVFEAAENGSNNVVMKAYYGNACNVPGVFDPATMTATFSEGTVTVVQGTGAITTPLVLVLSADFQTLTQQGTFAVQPSGMPFTWTGTLTTLTKTAGGNGGESEGFSITLVTLNQWGTTYSVGGVEKEETAGSPTSFSKQADAAAAATGCNLYISNFLCSGLNSGYANFDEENGTLTIPLAKNSGVLYFPAIDWVARNLTADIVLQMSADHNTMVSTSPITLSDGTVLENFTLTKK